MKITSIQFQLENLQLSKPYTIAWKTVDHVENLFCLLNLDNGITGYGNCNPENEVVGVSTRDTLEAQNNLDLNLLIGQSIEDPGALINSLYPYLKKVPTLMAALDIAIWDAWSKNLGKPLVEAFGKKIEPLPTSVTIGIMDSAQTIREAKEFIGQGFTHLKIKIGLNPDQDIQRLRLLREAVGFGPVIRTDINQGYQPDDFKKLVAGCENLAIELYEQPIRADRFEQMDSLSPELKKVVAADESLHDEINAVELAKSGRCGIFNIKLMKCGGLYQANKIAKVAEDNGIDLMWGCNDESRLSIAAAMHLAYACKQTRYLDLDGSFDLAKDLVSGGFKLKAGKMIPLDKPGLGVDWL
ncbi:MAG: dipeptide epimerase [Saprospiraceae bacterium]|nr:dipeptide epimerase [Saprospiraceae bacterium]